MVLNEFELNFVFNSIKFKAYNTEIQYIGGRLHRVNRYKRTTHYKWVLIVAELFNIAVNDFDAKDRMLVVTELVVSGVQCTLFFLHFNVVIFLIHKVLF